MLASVSFSLLLLLLCRRRLLLLLMLLLLLLLLEGEVNEVLLLFGSVVLLLLLLLQRSKKLDWYVYDANADLAVLKLRNVKVPPKQSYSQYTTSFVLLLDTLLRHTSDLRKVFTLCPGIIMSMVVHE